MQHFQVYIVISTGNNLFPPQMVVCLQRFNSCAFGYAVFQHLHIFRPGTKKLQLRKQGRRSALQPCHLCGRAYAQQLMHMCHGLDGGCQVPGNRFTMKDSRISLYPRVIRIIYHPYIIEIRADHHFRELLAGILLEAESRLRRKTLVLQNRAVRRENQAAAVADNGTVKPHLLLNHVNAGRISGRAEDHRNSSFLQSVQ